MKKDARYIIEYVAIGNSVKVTAFDPVSLKDASIIGMVGTPKKQLADLAIKKLVYIIKKSEQ